jgi:hypothetical protein
MFHGMLNGLANRPVVSGVAVAKTSGYLKKNKKGLQALLIFSKVIPLRSIIKF